MTLNQTIVAPWGIWQCADYRLTDLKTNQPVENWSYKTVQVRCSDGGALITYTGVGRFDLSGKSPDVAEWIAGQLNGHAATVGDAIQRIQTVASSSLARFGQHHIFSIGAISQGQIFAVVIANTESRTDWRDHPPRSAFEIGAQQVVDEALLIVTGETRAISPADWDLLNTVARRRPRRGKDFLELLAGVNRRAAEHKTYGRYISKECCVSYMPPKVDGVVGKAFGDNVPHRMIAIPMVFFGLDSTQLAREGLRMLEETVKKNAEENVGTRQREDGNTRESDNE
jgi:hypothetical protein